MKDSFEPIVVEVVNLDCEFALCDSCNYQVVCQSDSSTCDIFD